MASNADNSITGLVAQAAKAVGDNAQWAANKITGQGHEEARHAAGEQVTSSNTSIGQKIDGAKDYVEHGAKEAKDKSEAEKHAQKAEYHKN